MQALITNSLAKPLGRWSFEYKLYKANTASLIKEADKGNSTQDKKPWDGTFLYTMQFSQLPGKIFCIINNTATVLNGDFDGMLLTKLKSLWVLRQTIKADGQCYEVFMDQHKFRLRMANMFVQGGYKGLVIEAEVEDTEPTMQAQEKDITLDKLQKLFSQYGLTFNDKQQQLARSELESAQLYVNALNG